MNRGEEPDGSAMADDHATAGESVDLSKPDTAGEASAEPATRFAVVISGDGSATIDGAPVPVPDGMTVDAAILDTLHGHASDLGTPVTAQISDPGAGYVACVEVAPDGSSSLLDPAEAELPDDAEGGLPGLAEDGSPDQEEGWADAVEVPSEAEPEPVGAAWDDDEDPAGPDEEPPAGAGRGGLAAATGGAVAGGAASWDDDEADLDDDDRPDLGPGPGPDLDPGPDPDLDPGPSPEFDFASYAGLASASASASARHDELDRDGEGGADDRFGDDDYGDDGARGEGIPGGRDTDDRANEDEDDEDDDTFGAAAHGVSENRQSAPEPSTPVVRRILRRSGTRQSDDEYEGPGLLHNPVVVGPMALVVTALVVVPLVILGSGGSDDGGGQNEAAGSGTAASKSPHTTPSPSDSALLDALPPPPTSTAGTSSPSSSPSESKEPKGGTVTVTERPPQTTVTARPPQATVTAKPPQDTAAAAVKRLAKNDPSGRHICYRAYVSGQGWQKPVCDGTLAGTVGRNRPIKAVNIATAGVDGSSAVGFLNDPHSTNGQGKFEESWTPIKSGENLYVGSTRKGAPNMSAFAVNIGSGQICQRNKIHEWEWGERCTAARPELNFTGTLENNRFLEAFKVTV
ncbi:hypothetical protein ACIQNU_25040 [Streptomyces sp. NPDC091292]|uniref:hypothetical protein n=1 Tax=Streptomyces sp. NPDC091292 TaxID=3365991 RepID=UPI0037FCC733